MIQVGDKVIEVKIVKAGNQVCLGFEADKDVIIHREEIHNKKNN